MTTATFDTLGYFEKLKAAGVPENQAKAQADAMREVIDERLATKRDLQELEYRLQSTNNQALKDMELRLTTRFGAMIAAAVAIIAALNVLTK